MELMRAASEPGPSAFKWTLMGVLSRAWRPLTIASFVGAGMGMVAGRLLPAWYETTMELALVPIDDPTTPSLTNAVEGAGAELPLLAALLHSRQVADDAVARLGLQEAYRVASMDEARTELAKHISVTVDKKANTLTLRVEDREPWRVRELARALGDAASRQSATLWTSRSREHRERLERRLAEVNRDLHAAELDLERFRDTHHVVDLAAQVKASVAEAAAVEHLRIEKRLALDFARGFAGADSAEVHRAEREASGAAHVLGQLTHGARPSGPLLPLDVLPELELEHDRLKRSVDVNTQSFELLSKQVEQLRAVESRPTGRADVIDPPIQPRRPARPARAMLATEGAMGGFLVAALVVFGLALRRRERSRLAD